MNWDTREWLSVIFLGLGLVASVASVVITYIFTSRLVRNDNNREARADEEKWLRRFQYILNIYALKGIDSLQGAAKHYAEKYPGKVDLLFDAYLEVCIELKDRVPSMVEFNKAMLAVGVKTSEKYDGRG